MDMHEIAEALGGPSGRLRIRQAEVAAVASDGTLSVTIGGGNNVVTGVKAFASLTPVVGESVWLVTDGVDLIAMGSVGRRFHCAVSRSTTQSIPNGAHTDVAFDTVITDTSGMYDAGHPERITVLAAGLYLVSGAMTFAVSSAGLRQFKIRRMSSAGAVLEYAGASFIAAFASYSPVGSPCQLIAANAGDYFTLTPWQDSGGALNVNAGAVLRVLRL